jgi:predicted RND superfamily exporter protein
MLDFFARAYERSVIDSPKIVCAVLALLTVLLGSQIPNTKFDASSDSLVLEGDKDLEYSREVAAIYGSEDFLLVTYAPQADLFSDEQLVHLTKLRDELLTVETVSSISSVLDVPLLYSPKISLTDISSNLTTLSTPGVDKELVRAEFANSPIYKSLLTNNEASVTALQVNLARDVRYFELLDEREALRKLKRETIASEQQIQRLAVVESLFRNYVLEVAERQERIVATVRDILVDYKDGAEIFLGGVPMIAVDMVAFVKNDLVVFGTGILIFIVVLMALIFREFRWVFLPLLGCGMTAAITLGYFALIDWRLTVISSNFVAILLIINLSVLIHLVVRYRELAASDHHASQRELVTRMVKLMIKPCVFTTLTTLVAFASLVVSGIRPVIDFCWMMTVGVTLSLILSFVLLPSVLMLLPRSQLSKNAGGESYTVYFARLVDRRGGLVLVCALILASLSIVGITKLKVENRFIDYFDDSTEIYQGMETIDQELGGTIPLDILIDVDPEELAALAAIGAGFEDDFGTDDFAGDFNTSDEFSDDFEGNSFEAFSGDDFDSGGFDDGGFDSDTSANDKPINVWFTRSGMQRIVSLHNYLDALPETGKVLSLATLYEVLEDILDGGVDDIQLAIARNGLPESVSDVLIKPYLDAENNQIRVSLRVMETSRSLNRSELLEKIRYDIVHELGFKEKQVNLSGMLVLYNNMLQSLYRSQILTLGAVFVAIMIMFFVLFRSFALSAIAITPNLLAAAMILGGMGLAGIPLDIMTITIAAICIGIGVDDTIHYIHRFKAEFAENGNYTKTMYKCHSSIGRAMYYTSLIIICGFCILTLSNFTPSIIFGLLTGAAMFAALMGALLLLPKLLILVKPFGPETK